MSGISNIMRRGGVAVVFLSAIMFLPASCGDRAERQTVDGLNDRAYHFHYISLDSTIAYAEAAMRESNSYEAGRMEALNNIAFVRLMQMRYPEAEQCLREVASSTDNQLELLVCNVQMMRLCQRMSRNKEFYTYYWAARENLDNVRKLERGFSDRQHRRLLYAETEMRIVHSAYLYYVGQLDAFRETMSEIDEWGNIQKDTAQLLNYMYNVGSGDMLHDGRREEICRREFSYLVRAYFVALRSHSVFWQANILQAMSEHLLSDDSRGIILADNAPTVALINEDGVSDSLLAGNFSMRALALFEEYGDVYQVAGAQRSLSDCFFKLGMHDDAIACLESSLERDTLIYQAPALTASIYERLSINYSAVDDKPSSDYYRNLYLDTLGDTRQDRELDQRAEQLRQMSLQLNLLLVIVFLAILLFLLVLFLLTRKRRKEEKKVTIQSLLQPLAQWRERQTTLLQERVAQKEDIAEKQQIAALVAQKNQQIYTQQKAKLNLIQSISQLIERMAFEIRCLQTRQETPEKQADRYAYILELTDKINEYNKLLTNWIQLRKGELSLKIESFPLQDLFDIVAKGKTVFSMSGVTLDVEPTTLVVKADKALTLFMINTLADNARKAAIVAHEGGYVAICATETTDYVEISVADNGKGMDEEAIAGVFNRQPTDDNQHGFGLMNCKGIIEKYRKVSQLFSVCQITATSVQSDLPCDRHATTIFRFRLPHGIMRLIVCLLTLSLAPCVDCQAQPRQDEVKADTSHVQTLDMAQMYADSAYFCNLQGRYGDALEHAARACTYINSYYRASIPEPTDTITIYNPSAQSDLQGSYKREQSSLLELPSAAETRRSQSDRYITCLLDIHNEAAVAALALRQWDIYEYNNDIYTRLYRELSTDHSLASYVKKLQTVSQEKNVALVVLILLLLSILPAYFFLYYRRQARRRAVIERINQTNTLLLSGSSDEEKLASIKQIWRGYSPVVQSDFGSNCHGDTTVETEIEQIITALEQSIQQRQETGEDIEIEEDRLRRMNYENDRLHVTNNVLDNCFSALKHETMYYPARIRQIVCNPERNLTHLAEVTDYYKELFSILSQQARQFANRY